MFTTVFNLSTQKEITYGLPPHQAVIAAYEQYTMSNWNTWTYNYISHPEFQQTDKFVTCGDWTTEKFKPSH